MLLHTPFGGNIISLNEVSDLDFTPFSELESLEDGFFCVFWLS